MYLAGSSLLSLSPLKGRILDCAMLLEGSVIIADVGGWWVLVLSGSGGVGAWLLPSGVASPMLYFDDVVASSELTGKVSSESV